MTNTANLKVLSADDVYRKTKEPLHPKRSGYHAMYSSWYGGVVLDPGLMMIPIDDHGFHRGDAVFEAIKCTKRKIFALDRHLERLVLSAEKIGLVLPLELREIREITIETTRLSGLDDALLRLYVSRGPGSFTANPYDCIAPQFYMVITESKPLPESKYLSGAKCKLSKFRVKEGFFATVKSCNYLPNVLMKKEAVDAGFDFTLSVDEQGFVAEGSTENFAMIDASGQFLVPGFERTLKGVTAIRVMELAKSLVASGVIKSVGHAKIRAEDIYQAREAMMLGTTLDVLSVTQFEDRAIGSGKVGLVVQEFSRLLRQDLDSGPLLCSL